MSYEKVKSICITEDKVFINSASNNCRPLTYYKETYPYYNKILNEEGREAVEIAILKSYEEGNFQDGTNKYTKALKVLFYVLKEEYNKFNWRNHWGNTSTGEELRNSDEFKELLRKALNYKFSKDKFIVTKQYCGETIYGKVNQSSIRWKHTPRLATKFDFEEEAKDSISSYRNSEEFEITNY
tara:strand:- start:2383 stop:2931 length:549 start_codon:yes stop_codon:yes gene_type:complete